MRKHDGTNLVTTAGYDGFVKIWDEGNEVSSFAASTCPIKSSVAISSCGQLLATGNEGTAIVWELSPEYLSGESAEAPALVACLGGHESGVEASSVRLDGERCATAGWDTTILLHKMGESLKKYVQDNFGRLWEVMAAGNLIPAKSFEARTVNFEYLPKDKKELSLFASWLLSLIHI